MKPMLSATLIALALTSALHAKTLTVSPDGTADFKTLQDALAAVPENSSEPTTIHLNPGTYTGPFPIAKSKCHLTLEGDSPEKTILTYDKNVNDPRPDGYDKFNPTMFIQANDVSLKNLTIQNTSGDHGQALALRIDSDRVAATNVRLLGWQDTLMVNNGRQYFKDSYIEGRVDFIYGSGTALFDHCEIHSKNGGYVTAASTPADHPFGFVFMNCKLTGDDTSWNPATTNPATTQKAAKPSKAAYLGRPWRPNAAVLFMNCEMGDHIRPEGWHNWGKPSNEQTARYAEYHNTGPGAATDKRAPWSKQLTDDQAAKITPEFILGDWKP